MNTNEISCSSGGRAGTILGNSYKVESFLGEGSFGFVTKCLDIQTSKTVAVKVNKNRPRILEQAKLEMFILEQLRCLDPERSSRWTLSLSS
uniref:Protein kinase domain-containing protein n=1 Tax=Amphilophus citrinellus TaxID=61819 RepID=A0A3Q0SU24_AMPCI